MRLVELGPQWLAVKKTDQQLHHYVASIDRADGILFKCPKCWAKNGGPIGTHSIICWQPHVGQDVVPVPGRWSFTGTSFDDLTLIAGSSSILLQGGCQAHFFIRNGEIVDAEGALHA